MQTMIPFTKMQGLGNDFVVFNNLDQKISFTPEQIKKIADRHYGIGCDQVLFLEPSPKNGIDFGYRIYNPDGSLSDQCGNGARCIARFIHENNLSDKTHFTIATAMALMELYLLDNGEVRVNMGLANFTNTEIPIHLPQQQEYEIDLLNQTWRFGAVSMGNPHAVIRVDDLDSVDIASIGKAFNHHPAFPAGVNVGFMQILNPQHIRLRVYERGAGITLACGSGACAAMVVAKEHHWVENKVHVDLPGGMLTIEWEEERSPVWMTGPATIVYEGLWLS